MTVKDELLALKNSEGFYLVDDIIAWAKSHPQSALHREYEWDPRRAAHAHWQHTTRKLIAIYIVNDQKERTVVSLSIDRSREGGGYRDLDDVMPIKSLRDVLLADAFRELERIKTKYARLQELSAVWAAVESAKEETTTKRRRKRGREEARSAA